MTAKINTQNGVVEVPTATEYVPENETHTDSGMIRGLQRVTNGKGLELAYHEETDDAVNHAFVCDQCGQVEWLECDMESHLRTRHE